MRSRDWGVFAGGARRCTVLAWRGGGLCSPRGARREGQWAAGNPYAEPRFGVRACTIGRGIRRAAEVGTPLRLEAEDVRDQRAEQIAAERRYAADEDDFERAAPPGEVCQL